MKKLLLVLTLLFTIGCSESPKEQILGQWHNANAKMELFKDNTVSIEKKGTPMTGTYSVLDNNRLKMTITVMGMTMTRVSTFKVTDKELVLTAEDTGKVTTYNR